MSNKFLNYNFKQFKLDIVFGFCAIFALATDQITKYLVINHIPLNGMVKLIPNFLYLTHIKNSGAAFGLFQNKTNIFIIVSIIAVILIIILKITMNLYSYTYNLALGLILGGAIGNLFDRYFVREVTDFIYFTFFAVFNGADSFIVIGFFILIIVLIKNFFGKSNKENTESKIK